MNQTFNDIRDVRGPVDVPGASWVVWLIGILLILFLWVLFLVWQRYERQRLNKIKTLKSAWEIAYERLSELERQNFFAQGKVKEYFSSLSDIIRRYIEGRFEIQAPEMTTEEFLNSLKMNPVIEEKHKEIVRSFLSLSDMVKFAKYGPNVTEAKESFELVKRFVDETKIINQDLEAEGQEMSDPRSPDPAVPG